MKRFIYLFAVAGALLCSCDKTDVQQEIIGGGLVVSQKSVDLYPGGGNAQILLTSGSSWSLSSSSNWVSVTDVSGTEVHSGKAGSTVLVLEADVNQTDLNRTSEITFYNNDGRITVTVNQRRPYLNVRCADTWLEERFNKTFRWFASVEKTSEAMILEIESNTWWKIDGGDNTKYHLSQSEGEGNASVTIVPQDMNISEQDNPINLYLFGPDDRKEYSINLVQNHLTFKILNNSTNACDELGTVISGISVQSEVDWFVDTSADGWAITGTTNGEGVVENPITTALGDITIFPNETRAKKIHQIKFVPDDEDAKAKNVSIVYEVTQDAFVFDVNGSTSRSYEFRSPDAAAAAANTMVVNSSADWSVYSSPSWIMFHDDTDEGVGSVGGYASYLSFSPQDQNLQTSSRSGKIVLKNSANSMQIPIDVTQHAFLFDVQPNSTANLEAVPDNDTRWFTMTTSGPWKIKDCPEWIEFQSSKSGSYTSEDPFNIYFKANSTNTDENNREGKVVFVSTLHENTANPLTRELKLVQNGFKFYLGDSEDSGDDKLDPFSELGTDTQTIKVVSPTAWTATASASWITVTSGADKSADATVSVSMNTNKTKRNGYITFRNKDVNNGAGKSIRVDVEQNPYIFDVDFGASFLTVEPLLDEQSGTHSVNVTSSGRWEVSSNVSWLTFDKQGANSSGSFKIYIDDNTSSMRTGTVTVTNKDLTLLNTKTFVITQKAFEFSASGSAMEFEPLPSNQSFKITYKCSADVLIDAPDWCTCQDNGSGTITVTASDNVEESKRSGTIRVYNNYTQASKTFDVSQKAYQFEHNANTKYEVKHTGNTPLGIQLKSSGRWSAKSDADWLKISPASGNGDGTITVNYSDNTSEGSRTGNLTIICEDNTNRKYTIEFVQEGAPKK